MTKESSLSKFLPDDNLSPEEERDYWRGGRFDDHGNYIAYGCDESTTFFPWEWIYIPEILEYARDLGKKTPDGTIDYSKTY